MAQLNLDHHFWGDALTDFVEFSFREEEEGDAIVKEEITEVREEYFKGATSRLAHL